MVIIENRSRIFLVSDIFLFIKGQEELKKNRYFNQVTLDVVRTLKRFPPEISDQLRSKLQDELIDLICKILVKHNNLHYYQVIKWIYLFK